MRECEPEGLGGSRTDGRRVLQRPRGLRAGPSNAGWSNSCSEPEPHRASGARPPTTTIGAPLKNPVASADTAFVTPGPAVTAANPGVRFSRPVASAANTAVASWRTSSSRTAPSRSAARRSGAASNPCLPPTVASYSGKMCAPERVNSVVAPYARAAAMAWAHRARRSDVRSCQRCFHRAVRSRLPGTPRPGPSPPRGSGHPWRSAPAVGARRPVDDAVARRTRPVHRTGTLHQCWSYGCRWIGSDPNLAPVPVVPAVDLRVGSTGAGARFAAPTVARAHFNRNCGKVATSSLPCGPGQRRPVPRRRASAIRWSMSSG